MADVQTALMNVRFEGNNGHEADVTRCLLLTQPGHSQRGRSEAYGRATGAVDEGLDLADGDAASKLPLAIAGLDRGGAELEVARRSLCQRHECRGGKYKKEKDGGDAHGSFSLKTTGEPDGTPVAAIGRPRSDHPICRGLPHFALPLLLVRTSQLPATGRGWLVYISHLTAIWAWG